MSTPNDDEDLQQGLAGALQPSGQASSLPGLALSLLGNPGRLQGPRNPSSLAQGLLLGLPAMNGSVPGWQPPLSLTPAPAASVDTAPVSADAAPGAGADDSSITADAATAAGDSPTPSNGQTTTGFDVDKAVDYLDRHATSHYINNKINGHCGKAVRLAIAAGGRQVENTHDAKDYGPKLVNAGFVQLDGEARKNYTPQKGDVMIYPASPGHDSGHMGMYDGTQWVSDFKQKNRWIDKHGRPEPAFEIYRP